MPVALQYEFGVIGLRNVKAAFRQVEAEADRTGRVAERKMARAYTPRRGSGSIVDTQKKAWDDMAKYGEARMRQELATRVRMENRAHRERLRQIEKEKREAIRAARQLERERKANFVRGIGVAGRSIAGVGSAALAATGIGGAALIATRIGPAVQQEEALTRLSVASRQPGQQAMSVDALRQRVTEASTATGVSSESLVAGLAAASAKTGDLAGALADLDTIAMAAMATGADASDLYLLQADAIKKFGLEAKDTKQAIALLSAQGKKGSFELRAMAGQAPKVFAAAAAFGFKGMGGLKDVGGLLQVARDVTGSDEQAAFATEATMRQMVSKAGKIQSGEAFGGNKVQVFEGGDPTKGARDFSAILRDSLIASGGNAVQLQETFGEEGIRLIRPFLTKFREAGGGEKGADAAVGILRNAADVTADWRDVQMDATIAMQSTAAQLEVLNTKLSEAVASNLLPALKQLVPKLVEMAPAVAQLLKAFATLAGYVIDNPIKGLGALIAGKVALDLAAARIGEGARNVLVGIMSRIPGFGMPAGGGAVGAGGAAAGAAGIAGAATMGLAIGAVTAGSLYVSGVASFERSESNIGEAGRLLNAGREATDEQAIRTSLAQIEKMQAKAEQDSGVLDNILTGGAKSTEAASLEAMATELREKLMKLPAAVDKAAEALNSMGGAAGPRTQPNRGNDPTAPRG